MIYSLYIIKRKIEDIFLYPFIVFGRLLAMLKPLKQEYETFYFFPFFHTGGAEKVHASIVEATGNKNCIIFFTRKSYDKTFYGQFENTGCHIRIISDYTDNKFIYFANIIYRGIISQYINKQKKKPVVFNGQCNFGYKISPWINKEIPQIELIHSLCSFSYIRVPFLPFYHKTVMISQKRIEDHLALYRRYGIPEKFDKKIEFILNGIKLPATSKTKVNTQEPLKILYVGRDTEEKRVDLIASIAKEIIETHNIEARFQFMGEVKNAIPENLHAYCEFLGNKSDVQEIDSIYKNADVLLMVSTTEGFPMAIMEAMANGLAVISTAVGEIPYHVKEHVNGFVIDKTNDKDHVFKDAVKHISTLHHNRHLLEQFRTTNISHAHAHFGIERFNKQYQQLFNQARIQHG